MVLVTPRLDTFTLASHKFLKVIEVKDKCLLVGIYEEAVTGKAGLYVAWSKSLEEATNSQAIEWRFSDKNVFYLYKDGIYTRVRKLRSLLSLLLDKSAEIKAYLRGGRSR